MASGADVQLIGYAALRRRIEALKGGPLGRDIMKTLGEAAVNESKALSPKKTGNLRQSIHLDHYDDTSAKVVASANYALFVEEGTAPHEITPRARKALRWAATSSKGFRLTGTPRSGSNVGYLFATRVHHPGTKPHPFLVPGAEKAIGSAGLGGRIVAAWNKAS